MLMSHFGVDMPCEVLAAQADRWNVNSSWNFWRRKHELSICTCEMKWTGGASLREDEAVKANKSLTTSLRTKVVGDGTRLPACHRVTPQAPDHPRLLATLLKVESHRSAGN